MMALALALFLAVIWVQHRNHVASSNELLIMLAQMVEGEEE